MKGGEAEVIRYALTLEMIAAKAYLDNVTQTQLLIHCYQATDEEYRTAGDSLIRLCLWLGGELIFSFLEELPNENNALLESLTEPPSEGLQDTITNV